jgi:hypothetical protein
MGLNVWGWKPPWFAGSPGLDDPNIAHGSSIATNLSRVGAVRYPKE